MKYNRKTEISISMRDEDNCTQARQAACFRFKQMDTEGKSVKDELFIWGTLKLCLLKVIKLSTELTKSAAYVNAINLLISERQRFLLNLICLVGEQKKKKTPEQNHLWKSTAEEHLFVLQQWLCPIASKKN